MQKEYQYREYNINDIIYTQTQMGSCLGNCYSCFCCECNFMIFPAPPCSYSKDSFGEMLKYFQNTQYMPISKSGHQVPYMHLPYKQSKINVIYFHGNAQDIGYSTDFLTPIRDKLKANVYVIEYPTYGQYQVSFPARVSNGIKSDAEQFFQFLKRTSSNVVSQSNTIVIGRSIGSGGATYLASRKKIKNLVLISPFSSIPNVATDFVGCVGRIVKTHFDNLAELEKYSGRLLVIHGKADQVINFRHGQLVVKQYNQCSSQPNRGQCEFVTPKFMSHNHFEYEVDILGPIAEFAKGLGKVQVNL